MSTFDTYSLETQEAVKALYRALGKPVAERMPQGKYSDVGEIGETVHPVFALAEHFRGNDSGNRGFTDNGYRGDHLTIPAYNEMGEVLAIDISFHKGATIIDLCTYQREPEEVHAALYDILQKLETR